MLRAQIDNDRDSVGGSGIPEVTFRPLSFVEHRTFAKRSHVKHRKVFDMTYIGSTRVVDQASAHSLPLTVAHASTHCSRSRDSERDAAILLNGWLGLTRSSNEVTMTSVSGRLCCKSPKTLCA